MPRHYVVTEPVTEQDLLRIANQIARKRLAKGTAITSTTGPPSGCKPRCRTGSMKCLGHCSSTPSIAYWLLRSCFVAPWTVPASTHGKWSSGPCCLTAGPLSRSTITPSGNPEPSYSDRVFTQALKEALALVDVRLLDHLVVGAEGVVSLKERGQL